MDPHDWHLFDVQHDLEVRRTEDAYELRSLRDGQITVLTPEEFERTRRQTTFTEDPGTLAANPNPARITAQMWRMWEDGAPLIPGVRLGGIFADKRCYHNSRAANQANWPDAYCIRVSLDRQGPSPQ